MATKETFDEVGAGAVEDIASLITLVSKNEKENWFVNNMGAAPRAKQKIHYYLADYVEDAAENAVKESYVIDTDVTPSQHARTRLRSYVQTSAKAIRLSDSVDPQDLVAVSDELIYQKKLKMQELANDKEYSVINTTEQAPATGTAGKVMGVLEACDGTNIKSEAMDSTDNTKELNAKQVHDLSNIALQQSDVDLMMRNARENGKRLNTVVFTLDEADTWANFFAEIRRVMAKGTDVTNAVMTYATSNGEVQIVPSIRMAANTAFGYNTDMLKESVFRHFRTWVTGKTGAFETVVFDEEWTIEHRQPDSYQKLINIG